jgi:hypothetical protein
MKLTDYVAFCQDSLTILFHPHKYVASIEGRRWSEVAGNKVLE